MNGPPLEDSLYDDGKPLTDLNLTAKMEESRTLKQELEEHRERISELEEDWEVNDIQVDRWIEEEIEKD